MTLQQLQTLKTTLPAAADRVDIANVRIDRNAPAAQRAEQFLQQIKNPYAFRHGNLAINLSFSPNGKPLKEAVISYLTAQKNNV